MRWMRAGMAGLVFLACGCASPPPADVPRSVALVLREEAASGEAGRTILRRLVGDRRSPGELMAAEIREELHRRGVDVQDAPQGLDRAGAIDWAREGGRAGGILEVEVGRWDLESVGNGTATVEHGLTLVRASDGTVAWEFRRRRAVMTLRTVEQRDLAAFVQRMAIEAMRGYP